VLETSVFETRFNPIELDVLRLLNKHRVKFVLVGGVAVAFHGARLFEESTNDMDFMFSPDYENASRLSNAATSISEVVGLLLCIEPSKLTKPKVKFRLARTNCEFLSANSTSEFEAFNQRSVQTMVSGYDLRIASVQDLISMKEDAIADATDNAEKHLSDLLSLRALNQ
jgi:hypothetical protein